MDSTLMFHLGPYTLRFSKFNLKVLKTSCVEFYIYIYIWETTKWWLFEYIIEYLWIFKYLCRKITHCMNEVLGGENEGKYRWEKRLEEVSMSPGRLRLLAIQVKVIVLDIWEIMRLILISLNLKGPKWNIYIKKSATCLVEIIK